MKIHTKSAQKPFYSISFSEFNKNRTANTKTFDKLKDAREFCKNKMGYIMRHEIGKAKVLEFFGGFNPSATEEDRIKKILFNWNENS